MLLFMPARDGQHFLKLSEPPDKVFCFAYFQVISVWPFLGARIE
jgi:hypothetical protein